MHDWINFDCFNVEKTTIGYFMIVLYILHEIIQPVPFMSVEIERSSKIFNKRHYGSYPMRNRSFECCVQLSNSKKQPIFLIFWLYFFVAFNRSHGFCNLYDI
jgi:hypothetical protein